MLTPDKKPTASTPSTPDLAPIPLASKAGPLAAAVAAAQAATPVVQPTKKSWLSRETKLGLVVAGSFIALAAGVMTVKSFWVSSSPEKPAPEVAAAQQVQVPEIPPAPAPKPVTLRSNVIEGEAFVPSNRVEAPEPVIRRTSANTAEPALVEIPVPESNRPKATRTENEPLVLPPLEVPEPPPVERKKDGFTSKPIMDTKIELPVDLPPPPVADKSKPEVKNAIIRISGSEPTKETPPKPDAPPPPIDNPPNTIPTMKEVTPPIELPIEAPKKEKSPPLLDNPPIVELPKEEPKKVIGAPKLEDPPLIVEEPKKDPARIEPPFTKDPPKMEPTRIELPAEPPMKNDQPPLIVEPKRQDTPPVVAEPKKPDPAMLRKDGDFDEDLHSAKPNETYRAISKQYYNSESYAIALQRYNRDNPGQADYVRIPPIWVLEKKYQADINTNPTRPVNFTAPPIAESNTRTEPVYTVGDNGEMLADIAKKQLGSEEGWKRIWDLNPQVNPAKLIPGGTRLRLP